MALSRNVSEYRSSESPRSQSAISKDPPDLALPARLAQDEGHLAVLAGERRSHSSKPMRPRRASPNGTSERSSTRPPQYRASGSPTTSRGSATAFRERATLPLSGA